MKKSTLFNFFLILIIFEILISACNTNTTSIKATRTSQETSPTLQATSSNTPSTPTLKPSLTSTSIPIYIDLEPKDLEGTIIEFWHIWSGESGETLEALIEEFNLTNEWGILVVPVFKGTLDQLDIQVTSALEDGTSPDLAIGFMHQILKWNQSLDIIDLKPYINDAFWGYNQEEQADYYPVFWEMGIYDDQRYGFPARASGQMLFYNRTWAEEFGFSNAPETPEQFYGQACASILANKNDDNRENDGTGGWIISTDYPAILAWIQAFGSDIFTNSLASNNTSPYQFNNPEMEEVFTFLKRIYDDRCAWISDNQSSGINFAERQSIFSVGSIMDIPYQRQFFEQAGNLDQWTVIPFPSPSENPAITVYSPLFTLFQTSPEEQLSSWLLIKWLNQEEQQSQWIQTTSSFPLQESVRPLLINFEKQHPQWGQAVDLIPFAYAEPADQSWSNVRWVLSDASTQLFKSYFTPSQIPNLLEYLDQTAYELSIGEEGNLIDPTVQTISKHTATPTP